VSSRPCRMPGKASASRPGSLTAAGIRSVSSTENDRVLARASAFTACAGVLLARTSMASISEACCVNATSTYSSLADVTTRGSLSNGS